MISRRSARILTDIYVTTFTTTERLNPRYGNSYCRTSLDAKPLYDFLYERDYPVWLLSRIGKYNSAYSDHFRTLLLGLHTGETMYRDGTTLQECQQQAQPILLKLAKDILLEYETKTEGYGDFAADSSARKQIATLKAQLEVDGYMYRDKHLFYSESSVIDEATEQDYLKSLSTSLRLSEITTIHHHLDLSEEHYVNAKYDDSISNSRKVLDAILTQIASAIYAKVNNKTIPPEMLKNATDIRNFLERQNILTRVEREALDKNYGALSAIGGHPYIAEKDQARLMRHLALTFSQFVLLRYQGFLENNP